MPETPVGYFPDYDIAWDIRIGRGYSTQITTSKSGKEQRRRMFPAPASDGTGHAGGYGFTSSSSADWTDLQRQAIFDFLDAKEGAYRSFYWFRRDKAYFTNYDVGSVAAAASIIIPFKDSVITTVTVADIGKAFTRIAFAGAGGEDQINFTAGIQTGIVRVTSFARERWIVRCTDDAITQAFKPNITVQRSIFQLAFKQVR